MNCFKWLKSWFKQDSSQETLKELEADELVSRKVYLEVPPKVEYALTASGKELIPFIKQMRSWGEKQMSSK